MDAEEIEAIRKRCEAAAPGPWHIFQGKLRPQFPTQILEVQSGSGHIIPWAGFDGHRFTEKKKLALAKFVAHARTDIPKLLAALDAARKETEELKEKSAALEAEYKQFSEGVFSNNREIDKDFSALEQKNATLEAVAQAARQFKQCMCAMESEKADADTFLRSGVAYKALSEALKQCEGAGGETKNNLEVKMKSIGEPIDRKYKIKVISTEHGREYTENDGAFFKASDRAFLRSHKDNISYREACRLEGADSIQLHAIDLMMQRVARYQELNGSKVPDVDIPGGEHIISPNKS